MDSQIQKIIDAWLQKAPEPLKAEIRACKQESELIDRFFRNLPFGTGGLRGIMGAGTNRMNEIIVRRTSVGLASYMNARGLDRAVVSYDTRNQSRDFALVAACTLAARGIETYVFTNPRPTPELSYAVRDLKAGMGIVLTASHNPPEYNGYKVYNATGCQVLPDEAGAIMAEIEAIEDEFAIEQLTVEESKASGLLMFLAESMDEAYLAEMMRLDGGIHRSRSGSLRIVYTPLHGTGNVPVLSLLRQAGFAVTPVSEQQAPDGNFTYAPHPNPEDRSALERGISLAQALHADLVLGTDPDCDRVGMAVRTDDGFELINGNETGLLLLDYLLHVRRRSDKPAVVVKTIVTSDNCRQMLEAAGIEIVETLTGFKYIGDMINRLEAEDKEFYFGYEESFGYLAAPFVRDKDAVMSSLLICAMADYWLLRGLRLTDRLEQVYRQFGYFKEGLVSLTIPGQEGLERVGRIMAQIRVAFGGRADAKSLEDYAAGVRLDCASNETEPLTLPPSDVLKVQLPNGWIAVRPSGTEPKIKAYISVHGVSKAECAERITEYGTYVKELIEQV